MSNLVRWRANPGKVRVSIMKFNELCWLAKVTRLDTGDFVSFFAYNPELAIMQALKTAENLNYPGIDLGMQWAYEHPWKKK